MAAFDDHINTCKRHRMDIMDEYLTSIGCKRKPTPKDGSCLFRALSEQLFSTQAHHLKVRESCICYMKRNQDIFENFIDDPFDEYLERMLNPKEWADQMEISALSKMYICDFYIYEQPGQAATNVTDNDYEKKIYLCHSGQKHYDSVFPSEYFKTYGICQSIVYSMLFESVLGMNSDEESKLISTFRMLSCPYANNEHDDEENQSEDGFPFESMYEPSIGTFTDGLAAEEQVGLAYTLPVSLDFTRSLDPSICRNIDYDFWITIKRKQQYIDFSVAEGMQYFIGDRCLVTLNIYSKPLIGHVQEVSPNHGPITVFIEALGGMHTIAVKNAKPLESFSNGCRGEVWQSRWRRKSSEGNWNPRNGGTRRYSYKNKQAWERFIGYSSSFSDNFNFNPKYHLEFVASQQKRMRGSFSMSGGSGNQRNSNSSSKFDCTRKPHWDESSPSRSSKSFNKSNNHKYRWTSSKQRSVSSDYSPSQMFRHLSINRDSFTEETWGLECTENQPQVAIPPYPHSCRGDWDGEATNPSQDLRFNPDYAHSSEMGFKPPDEEQFTQELHYWGQEEQTRQCNRMETSPHHSGCLQTTQGESNNGCYATQPLESLSSAESNNTLYIDQNLHSTPPQTDDENVLSSSTPVAPDYPQSHQTAAEQTYIPHTEQIAGLSTEGFAPTYTTNVGQYVAAPGVNPPIPAQRGGHLPYSGTVTLYDCDGKEIADEKNPFQYFYNLGLEYYRQMNSNNQRSVPIVMSGPVAPAPYTPIMHPQPVGYLPPGPTQHYMSPQIQHQTAQTGSCIPVPHFHPTVVPPGGAVSSPFHPSRFFVHVPPPTVPQQYNHQPTSSARAEQNETHDIHENPTITSSNHVIMINSEASHEAASCPVAMAPIMTSLPNVIANYPSIIPTYHGNSYIPQLYPQPGPPYPTGMGIYESGGAIRPPLYPPSQSGPSPRNVYPPM